MGEFFCSLRKSNFATYTGCTLRIGEGGIEVSHLFFPNLLEIPLENIVKITQFNNRRSIVRVEYINESSESEVVRLRISKKPFILWATSLGIEVETRDRFKRDGSEKLGYFFWLSIIAFVIVFVIIMYGIMYNIRM